MSISYMQSAYPRIHMEEMGGKPGGRIVFDILGGFPGGALLETLLECGFGIGSMIKAEFRAEPLEAPENPSEWLAIDVGTIACDHFETEGGGRKLRYVPCSGSSVRSLKQSGASSVRRIGFPEIPGLGGYLLGLAMFAKENYRKNVVVFDLRDPAWISTPGRNVVPACDPDADRKNEAADICFLKLTEILGNSYVRTPANIIGRGKENWDMPRYDMEFYAHARDCIREIAADAPDKSGKLRMMRMEIAEYMDASRRAPFLSSISFLEKTDTETEETEDPDGKIAVLRRKKAAAKSEMLKAEIEGRIGMIWRDREDGRKDMGKALDLLRESAGSGVGWAKKELLASLWMEGSPDSLLEMVSRAYGYSEEGNRDAMEFLGWAYEDGIGLPENAEESAKWLSKAGRGQENLPLGGSDE